MDNVGAIYNISSYPSSTINNTVKIQLAKQTFQIW